MNANRVRFMLEGQALGSDDCVVVLCHEHDCVNPAHHVIGTPQDVRTVWNDQLHPYCQSLLREAFRAGQIEIELLTNDFKISLRVARAILSEEIIVSSKFDRSPQ